MAAPSFETTADVQEAKAEWVIRNFSFVRASHKKGDFLDSGQILRAGEWAFSLRLYPNGRTDSDDGHCTFQITRSDAQKPTLYCKYRVSVARSGGSLTILDSDMVDGRVCEFETNKTCYHASISNVALESGDIPGDILTISAWMRASSGTTRNAKTTPCLSNSLVTNWEEMFRSGDLADMSVECGSESIPCHSLLLMVRSPVFKRMLQADMVESKSRKVHVKDIEPKAMKELLHFLYTDKVRLDISADDDDLCQLLQAAHKYEMETLADYCAALLQQNLSSRNVIAHLSLADLYDCGSLRQSCLEFMTRTPAVLKEVQETAEFDHLCETRPKLLKDILAMSTGAGAKGIKRPSSSASLEFTHGTDWSRLSISNMKRACRERGLSGVGTRSDLKARLELHEK